MTLGEKIKKLREEKKLTQSELARWINIHYQNIGKYEKQYDSIKMYGNQQSGQQPIGFNAASQDNSGEKKK